MQVAIFLAVSANCYFCVLAVNSGSYFCVLAVSASCYSCVLAVSGGFYFRGQLAYSCLPLLSLQLSTAELRHI